VSSSADDRHVTEDTVENYLRSRCMQYGALVLKMKTIYTGFVDRMVLWGMVGNSPVVGFVELKRPKGGVYGPLQQRWHAKLRSMGYDVEVLLNKQQVDAYVERMVKLLPPSTRKLRSKGIPISLVPFCKLPKVKEKPAA